MSSLIFAFRSAALSLALATLPLCAQDAPAPTTGPATLPATPATNPTTAGAASRPVDINTLYTLELQRLLAGQSISTSDLASLPPQDQRTLTAIFKGLATFSTELAETSSLRGSLRPLLAMADTLRAQAPLAVLHPSLCTRVDGFGVYEEASLPLPPERAMTLALYCEVEGFHSRVGERAMYETRLTQNVSIVDAEGKVLWEDQPNTMVDACRNIRRDFYLARLIKLPASIPAGKHTLKLQLTDQFSGESTTADLPLEFAPTP